MAKHKLIVNCNPSDLEHASLTFEALQNGPMGDVFEFVITQTYLTPSGKIVIDWPPAVEEFFTKQFARKRPLGIPIVAS